MQIYFLRQFGVDDFLYGKFAKLTFISYSVET